jgi:hypothetical protein
MIGRFKNIHINFDLDHAIPSIESHRHTGSPGEDILSQAASGTLPKWDLRGPY